MVIVFIRAVILLVTLLVVMRFMGKRQIGEMEPFEFMITLVIAELICVPMSDVSIPLLYGIVSVLAVFILHQVFTLAERSGRILRNVLSGKPSLVVNENGVNVKELKKNNLTLDDLIETMRGCGVFSLDQAKYAIFESNGKLSVLKNESVKSETLSVLVVAEGKLIKDNLDSLGLNEDGVKRIAADNGAKLKDVTVMTVDGDGKIYFQKNGEKYTTFFIGSEGAL